MYKYTQSIYKILQEKYKKINSEHIYSERIQDLYRIALEERNTKSLLKIAEILAISWLQEFQAWWAMHLGWKWGLKMGKLEWMYIYHISLFLTRNSAR